MWIIYDIFRLGYSGLFFKIKTNSLWISHNGISNAGCVVAVSGINPLHHSLMIWIVRLWLHEIRFYHFLKKINNEWIEYSSKRTSSGSSHFWQWRRHNFNFVINDSYSYIRPNIVRRVQCGVCLPEKLTDNNSQNFGPQTNFQCGGLVRPPRKTHLLLFYYY